MQSPFDPQRFIFEEDSSVWSNEPVQGNKLVRFASAASVSSDRGDPTPSNHYSFQLERPRSGGLGTITLVLALFLAAASAGIYLNMHGPTTSNYLSHILRSTSRPSSLSNPLPPDVREAIHQLVADAIATHTAQQPRRRDFALRADGGRIAAELTTRSPGTTKRQDTDPTMAIEEDVRVGQCWTINTLPAQLGIVLPQLIFPTHISIEHIPKTIAADIGQAPRNMTLWGVVDGKGNMDLFKALVLSDVPALDRRAPPIPKSHLYVPLASFYYDIDSVQNVQTFPVLDVFSRSGLTFGVFVLEIMDNWGSQSTCLYRVQIHGVPVTIDT